MLVEDMTVFFNTADFAVAALYNHSSLVKGILNNTYITVNNVESTAPAFTCAHADMPQVKHHDRLIIENSSYNVVGVQPDGTGLVTLILEVQDNGV